MVLGRPAAFRSRHFVWRRFVRRLLRPATFQLLETLLLNYRSPNFEVIHLFRTYEKLIFLILYIYIYIIVFRIKTDFVLLIFFYSVLTWGLL